MRKHYLIKQLLILFISLTIFACSNEEDSVPTPANPEPIYLVSADTFITRTDGDLRFLIQSGAPNLDLSSLKYDATIFKVTYNTKYKGEDIIASGLIIIPSTTDEVDMLSFQHGTIAADIDAPSNATFNNGASILYSGIASSGLIAVVPDFIGFGSSIDIMHPYYVEDLTASAVIDNIKAAKELAQQLNINFSGDLYLAGYSQGGYATMATHKSIEENGLEGFNLKASFPSSGGYDVKAFQEYFFQLQTFENPIFMAYVVQAYKTVYDWTFPLTDFFNEPYASRIPDLFNGQLDGDDVDNMLNDTLSVLLNNDVFTDFESAAKYQPLKNQLIENGLVDWAPQIRMYMYHGTTDITVPYQNSVITYDKLIANGASTDVLTFKDLPNVDHQGGILPYISELINELDQLRN